MSSHQSFWVSVYLCGAFLLIPPSVDRHPHGFNLHRAPAELAHLQSPTSLTARLHDDISLQGYMRFFRPVPLRQKPETSCRFKDEFIYSVSPNGFPSSNPFLLIPLNAVTISEGFPFMVPPTSPAAFLYGWDQGRRGRKTDEVICQQRLSAPPISNDDDHLTFTLPLFVLPSLSSYALSICCSALCTQMNNGCSLLKS